MDQIIKSQLSKLNLLRHIYIKKTNQYYKDTFSMIRILLSNSILE